MTRVESVADEKLMRVLLKAIGVAVLGSLLSGCATQAEQSAKDQVAARAVEWADALMDLDYDRALTYMTPTYQNSPRADRFRGDFSGSSWWLDANIKWVKCAEAAGSERCEVRMIITLLKPPEMSTPIPIPYDTTWLLLQGTWYQYRN